MAGVPRAGLHAATEAVLAHHCQSVHLRLGLEGSQVHHVVVDGLFSGLLLLVLALLAIYELNSRVAGDRVVQ